MTLNRKNHAPRPMQVRVLASKDETDPTTFRFHHCWHLSAVGLLSDWSQASWSLVLHLKNASNKEILILWSPIPHSIFAKCNFSISRDKITVPCQGLDQRQNAKKKRIVCHLPLFQIWDPTNWPTSGPDAPGWRTSSTWSTSRDNHDDGYSTGTGGAVHQQALLGHKRV